MPGINIRRYFSIPARHSGGLSPSAPSVPMSEGFLLQLLPEGMSLPLSCLNSVSCSLRHLPALFPHGRHVSAVSPFPERRFMLHRRHFPISVFLAITLDPQSFPEAGSARCLLWPVSQPLSKLNAGGNDMVTFIRKAYTAATRKSKTCGIISLYPSPRGDEVQQAFPQRSSGAMRIRPRVGMRCNDGQLEPLPKWRSIRPRVGMRCNQAGYYRLTGYGWVSVPAWG